MPHNSRSFYSSIGLLVLLNAIIKPLWIFGIDRQVQNAVGTFDYGTYFSLYNLSLVLGFLLDWGFTGYFNRQVAARQTGFSENAGSFLFVKFILIFLYAGFVLLVAQLSGIRDWDIVFGVISIQVFSSLFLFFRAIITARQWFDTDAWLSVLDKTLMIFFCGSLLLFPVIFGSMSIRKFLVVQAVCTAIASTSAMIILTRRGVRLLASRTSVLLNRRLIVSVLPYAMIILLMSVHYRLDGFLLERLHDNGAYEAGIYAAAYRLLDAANMVGIIVSSFLLPYVARQYSEGSAFGAVILDIRHLLVVSAIVIANVAIFLAPWIQQLLYHNTDADMAQVLRLCLPALVGYSLVNVYGTVMTATGNIHAFCMLTLLCVIVNIVLNVLLIPTLGAKACSIAALVSQTLCGISTMLYVKMRLRVPVNTRSLIYYLLIGMFTAALLYWGNKEVDNKWIIITIAMIVTIVIAIGGKLFSPAIWRHSVNKSHL